MLRTVAPPKRSRSVELAVGVGVLVAGAVLVYAMVLAEGVGIRDELMLAAPEGARPGETIALRAYAYHDPDAPEGPTPEDAEVTVELRDDGGRVLTETALVAGLGTSREGALAIPPDARGTLYLVGRARGEAHAVVATVARPIEVADDAPPAPDLAREASPLSHFSLGPVVPIAAPAPPPVDPSLPTDLAAAPPPLPRADTLEARVVGGICTPEVRCTLTVDAGVTGVEPRLTDCTGAEPLPPAPVVGPESRYHEVPFVVHGPEGTCNLTLVSLTEGSRGQPLAYRTIRFPVALATPSLAVTYGATEGVPDVALVAPPGRSGAVVDVFRDGRWVRTVTVEASSDPAAVAAYHPLGGAPLLPGVYLLQARADALPTDYVAPRVFVVGGEPVLGTLHDPAIPAHASGAEAAYFLAGHEQHGLALPAAASGLADDRARLEARKRTTRTIAFAGMAVGIVLLVVAVLRRGLSADAEARAVMAAAGVPGANDAAARRRGRLGVVLMVLALGLALATGAALIAARDLALDAQSEPG